MQPKNYRDNFYQAHLEGAINSAEAVIPLVFEYISPLSVIDVGCGIGAWLKVWEKNGVTDFKGVDGSYIDKKELLVKEENFQSCELQNGYKDNRKYDLVSCLEVAEHLPVQGAEIFIESLCLLGDVVLFSAALPGQEGTMHINEQYPEYWVTIFLKNGYVPVDCLRTKIWNNKNIKWWYRQNILFFVRESSLGNYPNLKQAYSNKQNTVLSFIHPELFEHKKRKADYYESILHSGMATLKYFLAKFLRKKSG